MNKDQWMERAIDTGLMEDGGRMNRDQADSYIDLMVDETVMMPMVRTERRNNPRGELDTIDINQPVTEAVGETTDTGRTYEPTLGMIEYDCLKLRSAVDFSVESFEENIEGDAFRDRVMGTFATQIGNDLETLCIQGDATTYAGDTSRLGRLLCRFDGWYIQSLAGHVVDLAGATIADSVFNSLIQALPTRHRRNKARMDFFLGATVEQEYRYGRSGRLTTAGDEALLNANSMRAFGIPIVPIPLIPEDMSRTSGSDISTDGSFVWLVDPNNLIIVISREIEVYWEFVAREDKWEATIYTKMDCLIENPDAMVVGINLQVESA